MSTSAAEPRVDLNGRLIPANQAWISPLGEGFLYGIGLFETIKVRDGQPVFLPEHVERLRRGAAELGLVWATPVAELRARCGRLISVNGVGQGSLKLVAFRDVGGDGQLILTRENAYGPEAYVRGFRLQIVDDGQRAGGLGALKTLNYLKNIAAKRAAQAAGFDEPLFVAADGAVQEGATSNLFAVKDGKLLTPPADGGILPGIARAKILESLRTPSAVEERLDAEWLRDADEVFVTNSLLGVMPVCQVDRWRYDVNHNLVTKSAMETLDRLERESAAAAGA